MTFQGKADFLFFDSVTSNQSSSTKVNRGLAEQKFGKIPAYPGNPFVQFANKQYVPGIKGSKGVSTVIRALTVT